MSGKMHAHEVLAEPKLVRCLLAVQMPHWAELPLSPAPLGGTDNAMFRLGEDLVVRVPRIEWAVAAVEHEREWLPRLAPLLPVEIPVPLAAGDPGEGYPWPWSVYRWVGGDDPSIRLEIDRDALLPGLVAFVRAMRGIELAGAPRAKRGVPLEALDVRTRASIDARGDSVDRHAALAVWEGALALPRWTGRDIWVHDDLDARNLLVSDGRLSGVLDWSGAGIGDPAADLAVGWKVLSPEARERFRAELEVDDSTWTRARGWTLSQAVNALTYYTPETNPVLVREAEQWLAAVLADP
jgi:aminoglycoside phosphotransferase (APT) family kinase protein